MLKLLRLPHHGGSLRRMLLLLLLLLLLVLVLVLAQVGRSRTGGRLGRIHIETRTGAFTR